MESVWYNLGSKGQLHENLFVTIRQLTVVTQQKSQICCSKVFILDQDVSFLAALSLLGIKIISFGHGHVHHSWGNSTQLTQHMRYFAAGCSLTPTDSSNLSAFLNKTDYLQICLGVIAVSLTQAAIV